MGSDAIVVDGLGHTFQTSGRPLRVLEAVDLRVPAGGYASLAGPSGSGKSTLLALLGGLEPAQQGRITVDGKSLAGLDRDGLAAFRRSTVGFVFQHFGLLEALTAAENVALACALAGTARSGRRTRAAELLNAVGLGGRAGHRPHELSGGERQRVAIARALANEPQVLLADEPTGNLDDDSSRLVIDLLESISARTGCALLVVSHDRALARRASLQFHLLDGHLSQPVAPSR